MTLHKSRTNRFEYASTRMRRRNASSDSGGHVSRARSLNTARTHSSAHSNSAATDAGGVAESETEVMHCLVSASSEAPCAVARAATLRVDWTVDEVTRRDDRGFKYRGRSSKEACTHFRTYFFMSVSLNKNCRITGSAERTDRATHC
jgi:hypothetical protein